MFRKFAVALTAAFALLVVVPVFAADEKKKEEKELKLVGKLVCTKCELKETEKCGNALVVTEGKEKVTYYLDDKGAKEAYHKACCQKPVDATVTGGKVTEKDNKKTIEGGKVEVTKEKKDK